LNFEIIDIDGPQIDGTIAKDSYCENDNGSITVLVAGGTLPYRFEWDFSQFETSATVENLEPGTYSVTVTDSNDCDISTTVTIKNVPSPEVAINETSPQTILLGEEVQLTVSVFSSLGNVSYEWIPSGDIEPFGGDTVLAKPEITTVYQVWVTDSATGCISRDTITVIVRNKDNIFVPNAITPNGDGVNDTWIIRDLAEIKNNEVMIFSRWGDVLFTARPYNNDWDGTHNGQALPAGTYYYILKLDDLGEVRDGNITIIR
jgi:gliding motility-associated-like protein